MLERRVILDFQFRGFLSISMFLYGRECKPDYITGGEVRTDIGQFILSVPAIPVVLVLNPVVHGRFLAPSSICQSICPVSLSTRQ